MCTLFVKHLEMNFNLVPEVITEAYKDLLSPSLKNIGKALGTGFDTLNSLLLPLTFYNEKRRLSYIANIKRLQENLDKIPEEKLIEIPSEIAQPILDKFSYVSNEHLADMFHNLLIRAASEDTSNFAHPGFIPVINRLSPDEAKILFFMKDMRGIPALSMEVSGSNFAKVILLTNETCVHEHVKLSFPQNGNMYFENLTSIGLLKLVYDSTRSKIWADKYKWIESNYLERIKDVDESLTNFEGLDKCWNINESFYDITDYGRMFIKACIEPFT